MSGETKRRQVRQKVETFDRYNIEGELSSVIAYLKLMKEGLPEGVEAHLDLDTYDDYGCTTVTAELYYYRDETDEEIKTREQRARSALNREREQYEALKKKFGD